MIFERYVLGSTAKTQEETLSEELAQVKAELQKLKDQVANLRGTASTVVAAKIELFGLGLLVVPEYEHANNLFSYDKASSNQIKKSRKDEFDFNDVDIAVASGTMYTFKPGPTVYQKILNPTMPNL